MTGMRRLRLLLLLVVLPLAWLSLRQNWAIHECRDLEGSYDIRTGRCSIEFLHASEPFRDRHQVLIGAVFVALMGAGAAVWLRRRALRERGS